MRIVNCARATESLTIQAAVLVVLCLLLPAQIPAQTRSLIIERFDATVRVEENGWIDVREEIQVRFNGPWNRIFRTIPVEYPSHKASRTGSASKTSRSPEQMRRRSSTTTSVKGTTGS